GRSATSTVLGRSTGLANVTVQSYVSPRRGPVSASARAAVYMPCAIARGNPNALAPRADVWMGFRSPETAAYARPVPAPSDQRAVGSGGENGVAASPSAGVASPGRVTPFARYVDTPRYASVVAARPLPAARSASVRST